MAADFIHPNPRTFDSFRNQNFPFPRDVISYISQNPNSPEGLSKLQKTCKYFFAKNKIIVVNYDKWIEYKEGYYFYIIHRHGWNEEQKLNLNDFKYWLAHGFKVIDPYSLIISKGIYRCNLRWLLLSNQNLSLSEMDFFLNGGKIFSLSLIHVNIKDEHGAIVSYDRILSKTPKVKYIDYRCDNEIFSNETFEKMKALIFKSKIQNLNLYIYKLDVASDVTLLCNFFEKNFDSQKAEVKLVLVMENAENYKKELQAAISSMFENWKKKPSVVGL